MLSVGYENYFVTDSIMPRPRRMRKRAPRRRGRKARVPRPFTGARGLTKNYSYVFKPSTQWIRSNTNSGEVIVSPNIAPLGTSSNIGSPTASACGFNNYYDLGVGMRFSLKDCTNYLAFTGIYDQYRINSITVKVSYLSTQAQIGGVSILPSMHYVGDFDDASAPTDIHDVEGKQGSKVLRVSNTRNTLSLKIQPHVAVNVVGGDEVASSYNKVEKAGWIDCVDPTVYHYAGKWWFTNMYLPAGNSTNTALQWEYVFNVSFRGAQNLF